MSTPIAQQLDPNFEAVVRAMIEQLLQTSQAFRGPTPRPWLLNAAGVEYPENEDAEGDSIHEFFDRKQANDDYVKNRTEDGGSRANLIAAQLESDFLAGCERDYRERKRTRIRMLAHESARKAGYGAENGPVYVNTIGFLMRRMQLTSNVGAP